MSSQTPSEPAAPFPLGPDSTKLLLRGSPRVAGPDRILRPRIPGLCLPSVSPGGSAGWYQTRGPWVALFPRAPAAVTRKPPWCTLPSPKPPPPARASAGIRGQCQGSTAFASASFKQTADLFSLPPRISWTKAGRRAEGWPSPLGNVLGGSAQTVPSQSSKGQWAFWLGVPTLHGKLRQGTGSLC